ncbi:hypothetical protein CEXT_536511 [Caerostris extrusa]|uniref:Uncharacterized protein n=1 Tax=Caerostris extrusa TaxID=172846 RepID=A0AAV4TUI8_CAEEX|nr:hypothetical protein CEXT_536511 [Caerostris extrusa]
MFYVEIILESTGAVKDVKINHQADPTVIVTCPELVKVLKIQKSQAFLALQALETDLGMLCSIKRGYSLKLTYFISPYDLLDPETKSSIPLTAETVIERGLGQSVTVCIESSTAHKLQTTSLITVTKTTDGRSQPQFAALSNLNSTILPASFCIKIT